jgi:hypothetical protein
VANHEPAARRQPGGVGADRFTLDLTNGIPSGWSSERATVQPGGATASVRIEADGRPAYVELPPTALGDDRPRFVFSGRFRVERRTAGETVGLATVENSAHEHHADLFVDRTSGRCRVDLFQDDTALSPHPCDDGDWHRVTMTGDYGSATYTLAWTVDGVAMPPIRSSGQPAATVHRLWLGDATPGKTNVVDWADVTLRLAPA